MISLSHPTPLTLPDPTAFANAIASSSRLPARSFLEAFILSSSSDDEYKKNRTYVPEVEEMTVEEGREDEGRAWSGKRFDCTWEGCGKSYGKPAKLAEHMLSHTGERPHKCPSCPATYRRANHLKAHSRTHQSADEKEFTCSYPECGKKFWTVQHKTRHEKGHEVDLEYECDDCDAAFAKHHQLRSHISSTHCTPGTKNYCCLHVGCDWSFETAQKLKIHERVHDEDRYMCSHESHGMDFPNFRTWTDLRAHVKAEHPPECPYPECKGRTFKKKQYLRDHLQTHREHGDVLSQQQTKRRPREGSFVVDDVEEDGDGLFRPKKRKRAPTAAVEGQSPKRLRRLEAAEEGKEWGCEVGECVKSFKTKRALSVHNQTAHLGLRPFSCAFPSCPSAYGHKHLLERHISKRHSSTSSPRHPRVRKTLLPTATASQLLTGAHAHTPEALAARPYFCPFEVELEEGRKGRCERRFGRVYDLVRHVKGGHGLALEDGEVEVAVRDQMREGRR